MASILSPSSMEQTSVPLFHGNNPYHHQHTHIVSRTSSSPLSTNSLPLPTNSSLTMKEGNNTIFFLSLFLSESGLQLYCVDVAKMNWWFFPPFLFSSMDFNIRIFIFNTSRGSSRLLKKFPKGKSWRFVSSWECICSSSLLLEVIISRAKNVDNLWGPEMCLLEV